VKAADLPPAKPVEQAKAPEPVPVVEPPAKAPEAVAPTPVPAPAKPAEPPVPEIKKPEPPPPTPAEEGPSFMEENSTLVWGGGGILAVLLGYLGFAALRRKHDGGLPTTSRISEGDLMANSVFGSTGGQAVDTGASIQTDFSQSNLASINADEGVDPVAEADVYMAYGRDAQAEEILLDALKNDPTRHAIHLKLLEIYAARKSPRWMLRIRFMEVHLKAHRPVSPTWLLPRLSCQPARPRSCVRPPILPSSLRLSQSR
jgi:pilus assembly protein FimV